jgi:hypothetical protein
MSLDLGRLPLAVQPARCRGGIDLAGALFGGAAVLLGNWINRINEWKRAAEAVMERQARLTALITAELVDVAASLIAADKVIRIVRWELDTHTSSALGLAAQPLGEGIVLQPVVSVGHPKDQLSVL